MRKKLDKEGDYATLLANSYIQIHLTGEDVEAMHEEFLRTIRDAFSKYAKMTEGHPQALSDNTPHPLPPVQLPHAHLGLVDAPASPLIGNGNPELPGSLIDRKPSGFPVPIPDFPEEVELVWHTKKLVDGSLKILFGEPPHCKDKNLKEAKAGATTSPPEHLL